MRFLILLFALVAALAMAPVAPEAGNILFLAAGAVAVSCLRGADTMGLGRPIIWMPLLALSILAIAYGIGEGIPAGLGGLLFFMPFLAIAPLLSLGRSGTNQIPQTVAVLSLCGAAGAAVVAISDYILTGSVRAGESVANPIHFADVALAAGFLALVGAVYTKGIARYVFMLGPVIAAIAVTLSGTRGAVVALVAMAVTVLVVAVGVLRLVRPRTFVIAGLAGIALAVGGLAAGLGTTSGVQRVLADIAEISQTGVTTDTSIAIRLQMYQGALNAFLEAPLFGHGPFRYVEAANAQASVAFTGAPHLHSDIADFAASGGVLGLVAYALLLGAPLVEALRAAPSTTRGGMITITAALTAGYFVMGLTNAVFGVLTVTVYYAAIGVVVGLCCAPNAKGLQQHETPFTPRPHFSGPGAGPAGRVPRPPNEQ